MANLTRRQWLKVDLAVGGVVTSGLSYRDVAKHAIDGLLDGTSGKITRDRVFANTLIPEANARPHWQQNLQQVISMTQCFGCWTQYGVRVRIGTGQGKVLRITGNPYHSLLHEHHMDASIPFVTAMEQLIEESGLDAHSAAYARGTILLEGLYSPLRILEPIKRVGERGEGRWQRISFERLIREVVRDGDLFGEGHVDDLRAIHDPTAPFDTKHPGFDPKSNQLLVTSTSDEGRDTFLRRFVLNNFGGKNFGTHGAYCGLAYRAGSDALMSGLDKNTHVKPDWDNVELALFMGTSPTQSGNPFKRQARQLANTHLRDDFRYIVVAPALPLTMVLAGDHGHWQPVRPRSDSTLTMGMINWIIDKQRYNADYLAIPGVQTMQQAGERSWTNATHLAITDGIPTPIEQHLTLTHLSANTAQEPMVVNEAGEVVVVSSCPCTRLFVTREVILTDGQTVTVKSSFQCLRESAERLSLTQYSQQYRASEVDTATLADAFTRHGRKAAVITHGGMMAGNRFYNAWSVMMFNALIGNLNPEGGVFVGSGKFNNATDGPHCNTDSFAGKVKPRGLSIARSKTAYESSEEYRNKVAAGQSPFPAKAPRYPFVTSQLTEPLIPAFEGYPYPLKAWISNMTNPFYSIAGLCGMMEEKLKGPARLPLFIAIDTFMNETMVLADYIVPDTHNFENWGFSVPWVGAASRATITRWPVVRSAISLAADGQPVSMESFYIAVTKRIGLPGFDDNVITDPQGDHYPLNRAGDYYLRLATNIAFMGKAPATGAQPEDIVLTGVQRIMPVITQTLKTDEISQVAFTYSRGGCFTPGDSGRVDNCIGNAQEKPLQVWNANVAAHRHAITGERYSGCPAWYPPRLSDGHAIEELFPEQGQPLKLISFRSNTMSSATAVIPRPHHLKPVNLVVLNPQSGQRYGLACDNIVRITAPSGQT